MCYEVDFFPKVFLCVIANCKTVPHVRVYDVLLVLLIQSWMGDYVLPTWLLYRSIDKVALAIRRKVLLKKEKGK